MIRWRKNYKTEPFPEGYKYELVPFLICILSGILQQYLKTNLISDKCEVEHSKTVSWNIGVS